MSIPPERKIILYGAGSMGKRAFDYYTNANPDAVAFFADAYKGGTEYLGKPVLSLDGFRDIYKDYAVVLCIFDLFETIALFKKLGVENYLVWDDRNLLPFEERCPNAFAHTKKSEFDDTRPKILYGAGKLGKLAFSYYGNKNVVAFADRAKAGEWCYNKPIISVDELSSLQESHNIVICIGDSSSAEKTLRSVGVERFSLCYRIGLDCIPLRIGFVVDELYSMASRYMGNVTDIDFISHPEHINEYPNFAIHFDRNMVTIDGSEMVRVRNQIENKYYGYLEEMLFHAGCEYPYYDAPACSHGIVLDGISIEPGFQNLIDMGNYNKPAIHNQSKDCLYFTVGPYMQYVRPFYDAEEQMKYKKRLGSNLLVFPIHTLPRMIISYDKRSFVDFAFENAKDFDSISVCTYFNDFNTEVIEMFRAGGAQIVSAGFPLDPSFARRLKTIISCADAVLTNGIGTHVLHCMSLGKPIKSFLQEHTPETGLLYSKGIAGLYSKLNNKTELMGALATEEYSLTASQLERFEPLGGFSQKKTREEMAAIFNLSKRIMEHCGSLYSKYTDSIRSIYKELSQSSAKEDKLQFRLMKEALPADYESYINI